jgi:hypothetical protein
MNYRKRKKALTLYRDKMLSILEGDPLNMVANERYKHALFQLYMLKKVKKNGKRSKEKAKTAQCYCCFGVDKKSRLSR